jgi:putative oxidoreductase
MFERSSFLSGDIGRLVLRLSLGILILLHGIAKVLHPQAIDFIAGRLAASGLPTFLVHGVYVGEILAPLMLLFGLFTRLAGLLVAINMLFAIFLMHRHQLFALTENGGWQLELQGLYLMCGIAVALLGSGRFALVRD